MSGPWLGFNCCCDEPWGCPNIPFLNDEPPDSIQISVSGITQVPRTRKPFQTQFLYDLNPYEFSVVADIVADGTLYDDPRMRPFPLQLNYAVWPPGDFYTFFDIGGPYQASCWLTYRYNCPAPFSSHPFCSTITTNCDQWGTADCWIILPDGDPDPDYIFRTEHTYLSVEVSFITDTNTDHVHCGTLTQIRFCNNGGPNAAGWQAYTGFCDLGPAPIDFPGSITLPWGQPYIGGVNYWADGHWCENVGPNNHQKGEMQIDAV